MNHARTLIVLSLLASLVGGCLGTKQPEKKTDYYTLEYDPPKIAGLKPLPFVIRVDRFRVAPFYRSNKIVYKKKPFKRDAYVYHKWGANPGDLVTYFLTRDIKHSSLFKAVSGLDSRFSFSHAIEGTIDDFFELDGKDSWEAVLSLSISFLAKNEPDIIKKVLFQKKYSAREKCRQKNPRALAEAMSKAMARISETIITDIYNCLKETD